MGLVFAMFAFASALSGGSLLIWLAVFGFAIFLTEWLPRQVIVSRAGDRMVPVQTAIAANLVAAIWLALFFMTWVGLKWLLIPAPAEDGFGWSVLPREAMELMVFVFSMPLCLVVAPMLVAATVMPLAGCLLRPVEWVVIRSSVSSAEHPQAIAAVLALISGFSISLLLMLLPVFVGGQTSGDLTLLCWLAPFGLMAWFFSRVITSQGLS